MSLYTRGPGNRYYYRFAIGRKKFEGPCHTSDEDEALDFEAERREQVEHSLLETPAHYAASLINTGKTHRYCQIAESMLYAVCSGMQSEISAQQMAFLNCREWVVADKGKWRDQFPLLFMHSDNDHPLWAKVKYA